MRFLPPLTILLAVAACAHAPPRDGVRIDVVSAGGVRVVIRYGDEDAAAARQLARMVPASLSVAQRWAALSGTVVVTVHPTHAALEAAARRPGYPWLRAWARADAVEVQSPRTWSTGSATDEQLRQLLSHELTHCVLFQSLGPAARLARRVPLWFREGMATTSSGERFVVATTAAGAALLAPGALLHRADARLGYAMADRAFRYLEGRYGQGRITLLLARLREGVEFPDAFREVIGVSLEAFEDEFATHVLAETTRG